MARHTTFTLEAPKLVNVGEIVSVLGRSQIPESLRPYRLRIDPTIALFYKILDIKIGNRSQFVHAQDIPAAQFMHGNGEPFDCEELHLTQDFLMIVQNVSDKVPGIPKGCPLPFAATWACLIVPPRQGDRNVLHAYDGHEDVGTRIGGVPERGLSPVGLTPLPKRREHPGFGWDPHGDD
jgi:hypothetical protein